MISVVIPTYNEEENIEKLLKHLRANSNPQNITEIIVVEGNECKVGMGKNAVQLVNKSKSPTSGCESTNVYHTACYPTSQLGNL